MGIGRNWRTLVLAIAIIVVLLAIGVFVLISQNSGNHANEPSGLDSEQTQEENKAPVQNVAKPAPVQELTEFGGSDEPLDVPVFMFEDNYIPKYFSTEGDASIAVSSKRYKDGDFSLKWAYNEGSSLIVNHPVGFSDRARDTFGIWIYNEQPREDMLTFEFGRDGRKDVSFQFNLNFSGWRTAWVPFKDMDGVPHRNMNTLVIKAPENGGSGTLYFDQIVLSNSVDARYPTRDAQVPFVNLAADTSASAHWQALYVYDELMPRGDNAVAADATDDEMASIALLEQNFTDFVLEKMSVTEGIMQKIRSDFRSFEIKADGDVITGRPVHVVHIEDIYPPEIAVQMRYKTNAIDIIDYGNFMREVASRYQFAEDENYRQELKEMFIVLAKHLRDQGWEPGHSIGTTHHLGYNTRGMYPALFLMRDVLAEAGLKQWAQEMMAWFSGLGRIYEPLEESYANVDILNTKIQGMLASILMLDDEQQKVFHLRRFVEWLNDGLLPAPGLMPAFKVDGSGFHHMGFYPAYTRDSFVGLTPVVMMLSDTAFRISEDAHEMLKKAVMSSRLYANTHEWLLSVSGRHPTGNEKILSAPFKYLALSGTPDGSEAIDPEAAAAYLRLVEPENVDSTTRMLREMGYEAEVSPNGHWTMNYGTLSLHRRDDWLVGVRGHNRYFWAGELYTNANWYGRYMTYGQIQIMSGKNNLSSGFVHNGWDWNRWPGTTAKRLPMDELKAKSFTEMLLTDETYAGGLNLQGENGMFAMKLHEHPKYDESHRARKSVFMFDNRIIALGTDIENDDAKYSTETTLFQNYLSNPEDGIWIGSKEAVTAFPYEETLTVNEPIWLIDNKQNGYYVPAGHTIGLHKKQQQSNDQKNGKPTKGNFATAWIDHGKAPDNERYEYAIVIGADAEMMQAFAENMRDQNKAAYNVLQQDTNAHIVWDRATNTTAYALFEASNQINQQHIVAADTPSMVMIKETADRLIMSAVDPDMRLYEGKDPEQYNNKGEFIGAGPYSRPWRFNESQMHTMTYTLNGDWSLETEGDNYRIVSSGNGKTVIQVDSKDAMPVEFTLIKAE